jgi:L-lactate dehydrogenase complex protein LldE
MRVHLFIPCLVNQTAPATARATYRLLEKLGHEVHYDPYQTCCGQAPFNAGFRAEARSLAILFLRRFADAEAIVAPSGSCVSMVVHHYGELDLPPEEQAIWESILGRCWELTAFLVDKLGVTDVGASFPHTVAYHPSCHLARDLGVREQPLKLLQAVQGLQLVNVNPQEECCGFGGVFSVRFPELSGAIADRRAEQLAASGAEFIVGADDSCLHHLSQAISRKFQSSKVPKFQSIQNSKPKTQNPLLIHIARILAGEPDAPA